MPSYEGLRLAVGCLWATGFFNEIELNLISNEFILLEMAFVQRMERFDNDDIFGGNSHGDYWH
jgi:hypothetical protein